MANVNLKTQILLRNDTAAAWEEANPVLGQGEMGLETDTKKFKVGDGQTRWNVLDYYVEDVIKDLSGLIQVPEITQPTYTNLKAKATYSAGLELGSTITHLGWTADSTPGYYSLGYYDEARDENVVPTGENDKTRREAGVGRIYRVRYGDTELGTTEDSNSNQAITPITIDSTSSKTYATITGEMTWTADTTRKPINNIGKLSGSPITASATPITQTANLTLTGYVEGCFYGYFNEVKDGTSLSNADIRGLNKSGKAYTKGHTLTLSVPAGAASIVIACPQKNTPNKEENGVACAGPSNVLNTTVNAPMTTLFGENQIAGAALVADASGGAEYETTYNVWIYTPANPYSSPASLTITLG